MTTSVAQRCVLCGGSLQPALTDVVDTRFGVPGSYEIDACTICGLEHTLPRPSQDELIRLYAEHYNFPSERGAGYERLRGRFFASPLARWWLMIDGDISFHLERGRGRLLDIGCNEGRGLDQYRAGGFDAEGLEPNPVAAEVARGRGHVVHETPLEGFHPDRPYDVVVLSNVLEHFLEPKAMLGEVRRLLNPGGRLWISCPNAASWLRQIAGRSWINWHVPFHLVHFRSDTLGRMLEEAGFTLTRARQATPALWFAQSVIAAVCAKPGRATRALRNPGLIAALMVVGRGLMFPLLILFDRMGRGDCHVVMARRD